VELWDEIKKLEGKTLTTLDQGRSFEVLAVFNSGVVINPLRTKKERMVPWKQIEGAFRQLLAFGQIARSEIEAQHSPRNPAYVAAMLANLPHVMHTKRPIVLYYKSEK